LGKWTVFFKTETDPLGGNDYTITGSSQMLSVPYALYSANGTPGPQGPAGATGPQGPAGQTGATGPQGPIGLTGPMGATGLQGPNGLTGPAGATGLQGPVGAIGPQGPAGQTGAAGAQGIAGTNGKTILNGTAKPATSIGTIGDFYINTASDTLYGPKSSGGWGAGISLVGPKGSFPNGTNPGDMQYWDGSQWVMVSKGTDGQLLSSKNGVPKWSNLNTTPITTDVDGNQYSSVRIGSQIWMKENLKVTKYNNGDVIPMIEDGNAWGQTSIGAMCYYNNDGSIADIFGGIYNFYAVSDSRKLCPIGWHVPTQNDWKDLTYNLDPTTDVSGTSSTAGGKLKSLEYWSSPSGYSSSNSTQFSALPSGYRRDNGTEFRDLLNGTYFWSSTENNLNQVWGRSLSFFNGGIESSGTVTKNIGFSVRCIKD